MASNSTSSTSGAAAQGSSEYESEAVHSDFSPNVIASSRAIIPIHFVTILSPHSTSLREIQIFPGSRVFWRQEKGSWQSQNSLWPPSRGLLVWFHRLHLPPRVHGGSSWARIHSFLLLRHNPWSFGLSFFPSLPEGFYTFIHDHSIVVFSSLSLPSS